MPGRGSVDRAGRGRAAAPRRSPRGTSRPRGDAPRGVAGDDDALGDPAPRHGHRHRRGHQHLGGHLDRPAGLPDGLGQPDHHRVRPRDRRRDRPGHRGGRPDHPRRPVRRDRRPGPRREHLLHPLGAAEVPRDHRRARRLLGGGARARRGRRGPRRRRRRPGPDLHAADVGPRPAHARWPSWCPLRDRVRRSADGRLLGIERWQTHARSGGTARPGCRTSPPRASSR